MNSYVIPFILALSLSSCSALTAMAPALMSSLGGSASKGVSLDAQIGDRELEGQVGGTRGAGKIVAKGDAVVNVTTTKTDAKIESAENVIVQNYDPWMLGLLLAVVTLFVPSPLILFKRFKLWRLLTSQQTSQQASDQKP